jgi:hypothetical protein
MKFISNMQLPSQLSPAILEGVGSVGFSIEEYVRRSVEAVSGKRWQCQADDQWLYVAPQGIAQRDQGWKLHVSGTILSAEEILTRALPVLFAGASAFKVTRDLALLESLCASHAARESAGKFITIYPIDDEECGVLAAELDARLTGLDGPVVLSDLPYRPGSLVSTRYGRFIPIYTLSSTGDVRLAIRTPGGALIEDHRRAWFEYPPWTSPPAAFRRPAGECGESASRTGEPAHRPAQVLLAGRFLVIQALRLTAKGGVYLARDLKTGRADDHAIIKQVRPHIGLAADGIDARSFLMNEWSVLHLLAGTGITPAPVDLFQHDGDLFMARELLGGIRLDRWARQYQPGPIQHTPQADKSDATLLTVMERLCDALGEFHSRGLVVRDLSPTNILIDGATVRICDVEHTAFSGTAPSAVGTPGFNPPEQRAGGAVRPPSDLYALGALLYFTCTGAPPVLARDDPPGRPMAARMSELLASSAPSGRLAAMGELIVALLADDPAERPSLTDVQERLPQALRAPAADEPARTVASAQGRATVAAGAHRSDSAANARELAADLVEHLAATWKPDAPQPWHFADYGRLDEPLDIYSGVAGVIGVLARAAAVGDYPSVPPVLAEATAWLKPRHQPDGADRPGLFVGDSGIAWALGLADAAACCGGTRGRPRDGVARTEIMERLRSARSAGSAPPNDDFLYGTAGAIVAHAGLLQAAEAFDLTHNEMAGITEQLAALCGGLATRRAADFAAKGSGATDGSSGSSEPGKDPVPDYGFAHGAAGVGYGFLAGGVTLGDETLISHAVRYGQRIVEAASYRGDQAWWRGGTARSPQFTAHWCNGSSGVATFLIRLWWFTGDIAALETARAAARAALAGRPGAPACMCHGLAGDGELLLDLAAATGEPHYADAARSVAGQIWSLRTRRDGRWLVPDESGTGTGVDYGVGVSGAAAFLLRLLHGGRRLWTADDVPHGPKAAGFPAFHGENEGR